MIKKNKKILITFITIIAIVFLVGCSNKKTDQVTDKKINAVVTNSILEISQKILLRIKLTCIVLFRLEKTHMNMSLCL